MAGAVKAERNGRPVVSGFTILSCAAAPAGWSAVYGDPTPADEPGEDGPYVTGVRIYCVPVYAVVMVREVEYYCDTNERVPGCEWERVELLDHETAADGFTPWEVDDFLGYAPPGYRFRERDRFWYAAQRLWTNEEAREQAGMKGARRAAGAVNGAPS